MAEKRCIAPDSFLRFDQSCSRRQVFRGLCVCQPAAETDASLRGAAKFLRDQRSARFYEAIND